MTSRRRIRKRLTLTACALGVVGALALGYYALEWQQARNYQERAAREFDSQVRTGKIRPPLPGAPVAPRRARIPAPREGGLVGRLEIPRLRLSVMVIEGANDRDLRRAVGHITGTALPGEPGNVALAGHRDSYFRPLEGIRHNDVITLHTVRGTYRYQVVSTTIVGPSDVEVLRASGRDELTLVTCYPFHYIGSAPRRFIVHAVRIPA